LEFRTLSSLFGVSVWFELTAARDMATTWFMEAIPDYDSFNWPRSSRAYTLARRSSDGSAARTDTEDASAGARLSSASSHELILHSESYFQSRPLYHFFLA
jgi:hypothetical protein